MAIITAEQLKEKLENPENLLNKLRLPNVNHKIIRDSGRKEGDKNIPEEIRELAGTLALVDKGVNVADLLGISSSQVHHYKNGRNGSNSPNEELKDHIDVKRGIIVDAALDKLISSLNVITPEKLEKVNVSKAAGIAQKLASVLDKTSEKKNENAVVNFNIYAPRLREEKDFKVIDVVARD